ncbi:transcription factor domain-containing protein [Aspergillus lucknowensis]|uniref:Fungal-specific transcription factor domain-containing protein n=1 Tax=Aspergillus lucknowensis TaxID=176173 RepID=A0ABR4M0M3_9EURO
MLLVDTYFDCVHWFVLLFHQDDFRRRWQSLYECPADRRAGQEAEIDSPDLGFIGTFLMVVAIGIEYLGTYRKQLLDELHVDYESLQSRIFTAIRSRFLDIVAWGSLESTQTCVLLGTYYLFHGDPASAWPVCGCALRTALALGLHRKQRPPEKVAGQALLEWRNYNEARKRCWWAIYEIETFCSMSYGYPHAITDAGWDVEPLDPSARSPSQSTMGTSPTSFEQPLLSEPSLLSYKYLMSKLSVIIQQVLVQLYRIGPATGMNEPSRLFSSPDIPVELVGELDRKLRDWKVEIPAPLQIYWTAPPDGCYTSSEELDRDVGASGPRFWSHVFQLQALTLNLAYENARILIHRPLLSARFKIAHGDAVGRDTGSSNEGPLSRSLQTCRDAALQTARFLSVPVMALAAETYAAAFIGIHTFTAGLTLCILFNTDPLSPRSYEVKLGLQRLIAIQQKLKAHSPLPAQSLEILKYLVRHAMEKEWSAMLNGPQLVISGASSDSHDHQGEITNPIQPIVGVSVPESEVPVLDDPHSTPAVMTRDISSALVDGPAGSDVYFNEGGQQHIQDSTLLQAITDVDRVIAGSYSSYLLEQEGPNASWWSLPDQLSFPEQAWIWRTD